MVENGCQWRCERAGLPCWVENSELAIRGGSSGKNLCERLLRTVEVNAARPNKTQAASRSGKPDRGWLGESHRDGRCCRKLSRPTHLLAVSHRPGHSGKSETLLALFGLVVISSWGNMKHLFDPGTGELKECRVI